MMGLILVNLVRKFSKNLTFQLQKSTEKEAKYLDSKTNKNVNKTRYLRQLKRIQTKKIQLK